MVRTKDNLPVKLRKKATAKGFSIYLELNRNGKTEKKYLGLHLLNGTTPKIKAHNANVWEEAKAEQAKAVLEVTAKTNKPFAKAQKMTLTDLCKEYFAEKKATGKAQSTLNNIGAMVKRLQAYNGKKVYLSEVTPKWCEKFIIYLKTTAQCFSKPNEVAKYGEFNGKPLSTKSAQCIFVNFKSLLRFGVRKGYFATLPTDQLSADYKITAKSAERGFLDIDEIKRMECATCHNAEVKRAFLFSCFCGLRVSDIATLSAEDIRESNGKKYICKTMQKTRETINVPLNEKALFYLGEADKTGKYFHLPNNRTINDNVARLAQNANVEKYVCFHVARHTFATTLLTLGADIYTASKLLGHKSVTTTQIYADIVNKKKEEAINLFNAM